MSRMRTAAAAALAVGLVMTGIGEAAAGKKGEMRSLELVRHAGASDADAVGDLRIRTGKRGETGRLRLRNLDARTWYQVRDAESGEVLGRVRTNRRGKAKLKIRRKVRAGKTRFDVPESIEVRRDENGEPLLRVDTGDDVDTFPAHGFGEYEGADGHTAWVDMLSLPEAGVHSLFLTLQPPFDPDADEDVWYDYTADTMTGDGLPLGAETVTELVGRAFRIVDGRGAVVVRGTLPEIEPFRRPGPPDIIDDLPWFPEPGNDDKWRSPPERLPSEGEPRFEHTRGSGFTFRGTAFSGTGTTAPARIQDGHRDGGPGFGFGFEFEFDGFPGGDGDVRYDDLFPILPPDWLPFPMPVREESRLVLQIADEAGDLQNVGNLLRWTLERPEWPQRPGPDGDHPWCPGDDGDEGGDESEPPTRGDGATRTDAAGNVRR